MRRVANSLPPTEGGDPSPLTDYRNRRSSLLKSNSMPPPSEDSETQASEVDRRSRLLAARRRSNSTTKLHTTTTTNASSGKYPPPRRASSKGRTTTTPPRTRQPTAALEDLNDSTQSVEPDQHAVASKPPTPTAATNQNHSMSADHVRAILDENDRLRAVEREFWNLLNEREDFKAEVATLTAKCQRIEKPTEVPNHQGSTTQQGSAPDADVRKMRSMEVEIERLQLALHEAMELLLSEEVKRGSGDLPGGVGNVRRDGPVSTFVNWLTMIEERRELDGELRASKSEMDKWTAGTQPVSPEKRRNRSLNEALKNTVPTEQYNEALNEVSQSRLRMRRLQEELDRTDLSRQQALEDVEVLRSQLEHLNGSFKEVSQALVAYRVQNEGGGSGGGGSSREVGLLKDAIHQRDEEIKHLKLQMRRLVEDADRRSFDLASDTDRIRKDVYRRSASREPSVAVHEVHDADL